MINRYLPEYHFNEIHSKVIKAPVEKIYQNLRHLDFSSSRISRFLYWVRGLDLKKMSFDTMVDNGSFFTISEQVNKEWIVGLLAESFKMPSHLNPQENFTNWNPGKGIKIAWNFLLSDSENGDVRVSTETRILCLSKKAKIIFSMYWFFIRPFSGLIRLEMLRILKNKCEV